MRRCARTRPRVASRCSSPSPTCRRCSTAPATSTARATAAGCWSTSRGGSGPRRCARAATTRRSSHDPAFAVAPRLHRALPGRRQRALHDARELLARAGLRILAERLGAVESQALGATAREEEPHFWQLAGLLAAPDDRDRALFALAAELESELGFHVASISATTCVYKVMGAPRVLGDYYPDLATSASRPSAASATTATPPTPGRRSGACSRSRSSATTVRSTRSSSSARRRGRSASPIPSRRLGLAGPQPHDRAPDPGRGAHRSPRRWSWSCRRSSNEIRSLPDRPAPASTCTCARRWGRSPRARWR